MDLGFQGQTAFVTGASRGIGKAVALKLAEEGAILIICARNKVPLEATANQLQEQGAEVLSLTLDANIESAVVAAVEQAIARFGKIDILINNAGGNGIIKPILELSDEDWQQDFSQNFLSAVRFCKAIIPYMRQNKYGRIVNVSSVAALLPNPMYAPYCAAKANIISYSKALSEAFSAENILVNSVLPGLVATRQMTYVEDTMSQMWNMASEEIHQSFTQTTTLGRYATPGEIAHLIVYLSSQYTSYITGTTHIIDAGHVKRII